MKFVYLDNNATTQPASEVIEAMLPFLREDWGNPSSMHSFGGRVATHIRDARARVANLIGADPSEIIFTSCGTESNNTALFSAIEARQSPIKIITSRVEHPAVLAPCRFMKEKGHNVVEIGVDSQGHLDIDALRKEVAGGKSFVSIMWANNETGVIFPIHKIAEMVKEAGGIFHTDAVQAVGKVPVSVKEIPVDMLSFSGHKLHAPKGIGVLYVRKGIPFRPLLLGGHQESNRRAGTENVPYIVGLGRACELAADELKSGAPARMAFLRDKLETGLLQTCPDSRVNGDPLQRLPNTSNMSFEYIEGEAILYHLSDLGIAASSGSACTSGSLEPSHVIRAMGIPFTAAHGSIRFSLSRYTTEDEINYTLQHMPAIVKRLRALSPFVKEP